MVLIWSPHCVCKKGYSRLPNGKCVAFDDQECVALWKASPGKLVIDLLIDRPNFSCDGIFFPFLIDFVLEDSIFFSTFQINVFEEEMKFTILDQRAKQHVEI